MAKKLIRDEATGKLMRDSATGKLMRATTGIPTDCEWCEDEMPAWIDVTITGLSDYSGCCTGPVPWVHSDRECSGFASVCNGTFKILHNNGCVYNSAFDISGPQVKGYNETNGSCTTLAQTLDYIKLSITLTLTETGVTITASLSYRDPYSASAYPYQFFIPYTDSDECGDTSNEASNILTDCYNPGYGDMITCPGSGTASIKIP